LLIFHAYIFGQKCLAPQVDSSYAYDVFFLENPTEYPHKPYICAADSMRLSLLVFTQLFFESRTVGASKTGAKQNLTRNGRLRSFKVMHFGITEKPTTDCISLYNNAGLISKVSEETASENVENYSRCQCDAPP